VLQLLRSGVTRFVLVASPRVDTVEEARFFAERLQRSQLAVAAVVVNRCTPAFGPPPARRPRDPQSAALYDNLAELGASADAERVNVARLMSCEAIPADVHTTFVPTLPSDVHSMEALDEVRSLLFPASR
jgi:anion-transporting  ArsA/GET3 family ATPase